MDAETTAHETIVPVKVTKPDDNAPPTLAEPASGPAAEMSGALQASDTDIAAKPTNAEPQSAHGTSQPESKIPLPSTAAKTVDHPVKITPEVTGQTEAGEIESVDPEATASVDEAAPELNGTPAAKKGAANGKRKSIGGIPEHKSKKLNKKKSMPKMTNLDAKPGELYFARLKSYPPWPSIICDEEMLPQTLLNTRPVTTMKKDGTYNEPYADGGKKVTDRTFAVMFLFTNEFAWIPNTDLGPLNPEDCKDVSEKGKAKSLIAAYHVAAEGHELQYFKDMLMDHAKAIQEDEELREAKIAEKAEKAAKAEKAKTEKAPKSEKKKRKSEAKIEGEDVEMKDADSDTPAKKSSKKRKKDAESDDEDTDKPAKTPKTTKLKLTTSKTPTTTEKKPKEKATKPKSEKKKSKAAAASDEEMADGTVEEAEQPPMDPVEARKAREKEVLFLRHKLQKGFLSRDQAPQEEEMPQMSNFIKKLENYGDLEVSIIRNTKINKVLKALVKLNSIPKDEEFNFRKRSVDLLAKWNKILGADPTDGEAPGDKESKGTPTTNGVHDEQSEGKKEEPTDSQSKSAQEDTNNTAVQENASTNEPVKADTSSGVLEKAPESAEAAAEVNQVVKDAE